MQLSPVQGGTHWLAQQMSIQTLEQRPVPSMVPASVV